MKGKLRTWDVPIVEKSLHSNKYGTTSVHACTVKNIKTRYEMFKQNNISKQVLPIFVDKCVNTFFNLGTFETLL